jgi:hypothetical protein
MAYLTTSASRQAFAELLDLLSRDARASYRRRAARPLPGGATLRPGPTTPLWNRLAAQIRPWLKRRGEKAQLARLLGLHRQAVNEYFASGSRMPDAERTLLLLEWLAARRAHRPPPS